MKHPKIRLESTISRSQDLASTEVDGELVLVDIDSGDYFGFDTILTRIWALLDEPTAVSTLIDRLLEEYDVERGVCERDTLEVLNRMLDDKLIRLA